MKSSGVPRSRILVVDDSAFEQRMLAELLGEYDHTVLAAYNGPQGYELAASAQPDLILLDVRMPDVDGFATCRLLKANPDTAAIPVIFVSGADAAEEKVLGLSVGAVDYVSKPFSGAELAARIQVHLRLARRDDNPATLPPLPGSSADHVLVLAARQLIDTDLANVPTLDQIAERIGSDREKLSQVFREQMGCTVFAYIRDQRIARGAALLRETEIDIQGIALLLGFHSAGNFATAFRERNGMPPSTYRKMYTTGPRH
ncbi:response regulator [Massilia sp. CF038]|uniref:response regulator transcription factor n=1 Tax=Massilia sp. CF038 TaxID=1881045 RepID=UPI000922B7C0|nr:response regulator [Massilia sp. CF038]SHH12450.1 two component transcriptional regulator, AraC family [Massilia sp. CF038]